MRITSTIFLILSFSVVSSQPDSIFDQGTYRTFILHLPENYNPESEYPVVLNLHGLGSNAIEQLLYSGFNEVANEEEFIVVYADAINNSWDLFGSLDVTFLSNLVDTIRDRYSTNDCLFSMGMSQGGFLSYKLACELDHPLSAIAVVTGNMLTFWQENCSVVHGLPVMHFHGTADQVVDYNGSFGVSPVEETAQWWANENNCNITPDITSLPDIDPDDGSTAEQYDYNECSNSNEVILYKIINGGHTWPGAISIQSLGNTNQDINASVLIGDFFTAHCNTTTAVPVASIKNDILLYPNPFRESLTIEWPDRVFDLIIYDLNGKRIFTRNNIAQHTMVNCHDFKNGIYMAELISTEGGTYSTCIIHD